MAQLRQANELTSQALATSQSALAVLNQNASYTSAPKPHKPPSFNGKDSVDSWTMHLDNYLGDQDDERAMQVATTYLTGEAHEWWIVHSSVTSPAPTTWSGLRSAITMRFNPLNKVKQARDKLSRWKQVRSVSAFNREFLKIVLDIPTITMEEQVDRYSRALKPYIWRELCTTNNSDLATLMRDAERVEAAHSNGPRKNNGTPSFKPKSDFNISGVTPNGYWQY